MLVVEAGRRACGSSFYYFTTFVYVKIFIIFKNKFENVGEKDTAVFLRAAKNECNVVCSWV